MENLKNWFYHFENQYFPIYKIIESFECSDIRKKKNSKIKLSNISFKCRTADLTKVTTIKNENWEEIHLYQRANMRICKIASDAEYRIDEPFQNLPIFRIWNWKKS